MQVELSQEKSQAVGRLRLKSDVELSRHDADTVVLVSASRLRPIKFSGLSSQLIELVQHGCEENSLVTYLTGKGHPPGQIPAFVQRFLQAISSMDLLEAASSGGAAPRSEDPKKSHLDRIACVIAKPFANVSARTKFILIAALLAGSISIISKTLLEVNVLEWTRGFSFSSSLWVLLGVVFWIMTHELAHAVVCRSVGCKVSGMRMKFRRFSLPSIYVDTRYAPLLKNKYDRAKISFSGILADIYCLALVCLIMLAVEASPAMRLLFLVLCCGLFFNLNPWRISDLSNTLSALLDDPFLCEKAFSLRGGVEFKHKAYRVWAGVYLGMFAMLLVWLAGLIFDSTAPSFR